MTQDDQHPPSRPGHPGATGPAMPPSVQAATLTSAIVRVARVHRMLAGQLLRRVGLHPGQELVMMQLWDAGPQRQVDLVRLLGSDAATMTRAVQRLERAGFVRREPDPQDGRASIISASTASLAVRDQVDQIWAELEGSTRGDAEPTRLSDQEVSEVTAALGRITDHLVRTLDADGGA